MSDQNPHSKYWEGDIPPSMEISRMLVNNTPDVETVCHDPYRYDFKSASKIFETLTAMIHNHGMKWRSMHVSTITKVSNCDDGDALELKMRYFTVKVVVRGVEVLLWSVLPTYFIHADDNGVETGFTGVRNLIRVAGMEFAANKFLAMSELETTLLLDRAARKEPAAGRFPA